MGVPLAFVLVYCYYLIFSITLLLIQTSVTMIVILMSTLLTGSACMWTFCHHEYRISC